jgi:hypothetical protein
MKNLPGHNYPFKIVFENGQQARVVRVYPESTPSVIYRLLGFYVARPVIFVSGGAGKMTDQDRQLTRDIIAEVAQFAEDHQAIIVDGGTESGIMKMVGDTRGDMTYTFPLIGVSPLGKISYPGYKNPDEESFLEDSHSHFVLVDGNEWGAESETLVGLAHAVSGSGRKPVVGVLINGGQIAMHEMYLATTKKQKIPIVVLDGSGRTADEISTAVRTGKASQSILKAIIAGGDIELVGTTEGPEAMRAKLQDKFDRHGG